MNPLSPSTFSSKLVFLSTSGDRKTLVNRALERSDNSRLTKRGCTASQTAVKGFSCIHRFLKANQGHLSKLHTPSLEKVKALVQEFEKLNPPKKLSECLKTLQKTIDASVELTKMNSALPKNLILIVNDYCDSIDESIKLSTLDNFLSPEDLAKSITYANKDKIEAFKKQMCKRCKCRPELAEMAIKVFFQYATKSQKNYFFSLIKKGEERFLSVALTAISQNTVHLKLTCYPVVTDHHLKIIKDFPNLEFLDLSNCNKITNKGIKALAASPNMGNLQILILENCPRLSQLEVQRIIATATFKLKEIPASDQTDEEQSQIGDQDSSDDQLRQLDGGI